MPKVPHTNPSIKLTRLIGFSVLAAWVLVSYLHAEPRVWKSTSGSTIEAIYLGTFGEDYWFETAGEGRFIKMPAKYISSKDIDLVESGEVKGSFPPSICDKNPASIRLLEQLYTSPAVELESGITGLDDAVEQLLAPFQPDAESEAEPFGISFTKRRYKKASIEKLPEEGTAFEALEQLLKPHELGFRIREGELIVGKH